MRPTTGAVASLGAGILGIPLWALSYAWVPFRHLDPGPGWVWPTVVVGEVGAIGSAVVALVLGLWVRSDARADRAVRRRAGWGAGLGAGVLALVIGPNLAFLLFA